MKKYLIFFILIIVVFGIIFYQNSDKITEGFNPYLDMSRVYPSYFAFNHDYGLAGPTDKSYYMYPEGIYMPIVFGNNYRNSPGYRDYWYIPKMEYLKNAMGRNYGNGLSVYQDYQNYQPYDATPFNYYPYNQDCVNDQIQIDGNLDLAIMRCNVLNQMSPSYP